MTESQTLLAEYVTNGSEAAFRELVSRYIDFVYSAAARLVEGAPHLAEDVTQIVFADLAVKGRSLSGEVMLGGWLHRRTCHVAATIMRGERRRRSRERQAAEMNSLPDHTDANLARVAPMLDDAINRLSAADRTAILLRFFEQRDLRSVGQALGGNEEAARKRISRALEKLQILLKHRGVTLSAAALAGALGAGVVSAAPTGLSAAVSGSAMAGAAAGTGTALTLLKIMVMTKLKITVLSAVVVAGIVASVVVQQRADARLRQDEDALRKQADQFALLQSEHARFANLAPVQAKNPADDLKRLRTEVAALRQRTNDLAALRQEDRDLKKAMEAEASHQSPMQVKAEAIIRLNFSKQCMLGFFMYAQEHQGQFPTNFDDAMAILDSSVVAKAAESNVTTDQFAIVYQGYTASVTNAADLVVLKEKEAWQGSNGQWCRIYAFADGHVAIQNAPDGNFDDWESKHIMPPTAR